MINLHLNLTRKLSLTIKPLFGAILLFGLILPAKTQNASSLLIKSGESIAFLGDSITAGGWADGGYVKLIIDGLAKQKVAVTAIPAGVGGNTSKDMLARLDDDVMSKKPNWMTLSCGVNDVWHGNKGVDLENYKKNITAILDRAQAQGVKVVILTATPIYEDLNNDQNKALVAYNEYLRTVAKERSLPLADLNAVFATALGKLPVKRDSRYFTVDGVHMNPEGNVMMAKGCLGAMGMGEEKIAQIEQSWLTQADTAFIATGSFDPRPRLGITLAQFRTLQKIAVERNLDFVQLNLTLWFQSLGEVLPNYATATSIDGEKLKRETNVILLQKINALTAKER